MFIFRKLFSFGRGKGQSGQVVMIVLLLMLVGMTVGVSILIDTMSEVTITGSEERSEDVFNAAEAAVEEVLLLDYRDIKNETIDVGDIEVDVKIGEEVRTMDAKAVPQNSVVTVNTEGMEVSSKLLIKWTLKDDEVQDPVLIDPGFGDERDWYYVQPSLNLCVEGVGRAPASLYVERWYRVGSTPRVDRYVYDASRCESLVEGSSIPSNPGTDGYLSQVETGFDVGPDDLFLRIRPLFNDADIFVGSSPADALPPQRLTVTAQSGEEEVRAILVERSFGSIPDIFDYVLLSGSKVIKE
jgi:hypothetical protein